MITLSISDSACGVSVQSRSLPLIRPLDFFHGTNVRLRILRSREGGEREASLLLTMRGTTVASLRIRSASGSLSGHVAYAGAIRVEHQSEPQVLIRFDEGNLTSYGLYRIDGRHIRRSFSYATRYDDSIHWIVGAHGLKAIEVLDRIGVPEDERLARYCPAGKAWVHHRRYSLSRRKDWTLSADRGECVDLARGNGWRVIGQGRGGWFEYR